MKKILMFIVIACCMASASDLCAKTPKEITKERTQVTKYANKEFKKKASKEARKEAKRFAKEGWQIMPGALPLEKQLDRSYLMLSEYDEYGYQRFIMGEGMSIGEHYDAAKMQAVQMAKQNLVGQIHSEIEGVIQNQVANQQLSQGEAASITRTIAATQSQVVQTLGRIIPVVEVYRTLENGNKEIFVRIAYSSDMAREVTKQAIRDELKKESEELLEKFNIGIQK